MPPKRENNDPDLAVILLDWGMSEHLKSESVSAVQIGDEAFDTIDGELRKQNLTWEDVTDLYRVTWQGPDEPEQKPFVIAHASWDDPYLEHAYYIVQGSQLIANVQM